MQFSEISYSYEQQEVFSRFDKIGVALETVILLCDGLTEPTYSNFRDAAIKGMEVLAARYTRWFQETNPGISIEDYFQILILPGEELSGQKITFTEFIGNGFDLQSSTLRFNDAVHDEIHNGFVYALLNPPHRLKVDTESNFGTEDHLNKENWFYEKLFATFLKTMLNIPDINNITHLEFFRWSDDWSNYFDAGKEWWGTFCWTVYNSRNNTITFIAASTTD